jgi:hypothetical protein
MEGLIVFAVFRFPVALELEKTIGRKGTHLLSSGHDD